MHMYIIIFIVACQYIYIQIFNPHPKEPSTRQFPAEYAAAAASARTAITSVIGVSLRQPNFNRSVKKAAQKESPAPIVSTGVILYAVPS